VTCFPSLERGASALLTNDILCRQREGIVPELLARLRETVQPGQQASKRVFEVTQGVLQGMDGRSRASLAWRAPGSIPSPARDSRGASRNFRTRKCAVRGRRCIPSGTRQPSSPWPAPDRASARHSIYWRAESALSEFRVVLFHGLAQVSDSSVPLRTARLQTFLQGGQRHLVFA
jgi:hypothetical protein